MNEQKPRAGERVSNPPQRAWRRFTAIVLVATAIGAFGAAQAHGGFGRGGWQEMDPETMGRRIEAIVSFKLADVDATPEQRARISAIAKGAFADLAPLRQQHRQARQRALELFSAPTIDRAAIERLRIEQTQLGETITRRVTQAMLDAAEVLTPQQRAQLAAKMQQRRGGRH